MPIDEPLCAVEEESECCRKIRRALRFFCGLVDQCDDCPQELHGVWLDLPAGLGYPFAKMFGDVSYALQRSLREWLPELYFQDAERFRSHDAYFMLVYQASIPCVSKRRGQFAYEYLDITASVLTRPSTKINLKRILKQFHPRVFPMGLRVAAQYSRSAPERILNWVQKHPGKLSGLLAADAFFLESFVCLAAKGREYARRAARDPEKATRSFEAYVADMARAFCRRLEHIYADLDASSIGPALMKEAALALAASKEELKRKNLFPDRIEVDAALLDVRNVA